MLHSFKLCILSYSLNIITTCLPYRNHACCLRKLTREEAHYFNIEILKVGNVFVSCSMSFETQYTLTGSFLFAEYFDWQWQVSDFGYVWYPEYWHFCALHAPIYDKILTTKFQLLHLNKQWPKIHHILKKNRWIPNFRIFLRKQI